MRSLASATPSIRRSARSAPNIRNALSDLLAQSGGRRRVISLIKRRFERDRRYKLGAGGPRIEIDDAYIGGERTGEGSGRGRRGHTPFVIAIETTADRRPLYARLQVVRGFQTAE